ncbi:hypothetical protein STENM327S_05404 [Streptomyces tendae]
MSYALEGDDGGRPAQPLAQGGPAARRVDRGAREGSGGTAPRSPVAPGDVDQRERPVARPRRSDVGQAPVAAHGPHDRHGRLGQAGQHEQGGRASVDECVAQGRGGRLPHVDVDDGAAAWSEAVAQDAGAGRPVEARLGGDGDAAVAGGEEEVREGPPAVGLRRGETRDPGRRLFGERVEHGRRAQEGQSDGIGPGGGGACDDAVVLPRQGGYTQPGQVVHGRRGPVRIGRRVPDHQFEWCAADAAGVVDVAYGQFHPGEQVPARLVPAGPGQRRESADPYARVRLVPPRWRHLGDHARHCIRHRCRGQPIMRPVDTESRSRGVGRR